jgi:hypothetical protein
MGERSMAVINNVTETLHRIRAKLYPNHLPGAGEGQYIARTDDEASLSVEQVCAALKNRGGFTGNYQDLVEYVKQFFDEAAYQICDGYSVNTGYYSLHPRIGGFWKNAQEPFDPSKHKISITFRTLKGFRDIFPHIDVFIEGVADTQSYIADIVDVTTEAVNEALTPAGMFSLTGHKIKISGDNADCGIYFVSMTNPAQRVKVTGHLAENSPAKVIGLVPALAGGQWQVEVVTQFTSGTSLLKEPRTAKLMSALTVS